MHYIEGDDTFELVDLTLVSVSTPVCYLALGHVVSEVVHPLQDELAFASQRRPKVRTRTSRTLLLC